MAVHYLAYCRLRNGERLNLFIKETAHLSWTSSPGQKAVSTTITVDMIILIWSSAVIFFIINFVNNTSGVFTTSTRWFLWGLGSMFPLRRGWSA